MTSLQLYFLGPLDMRSSGQQLPRPPTQKSQSLLAYLALHRDRPQTRDRLIGLFWAERPERNARRSLSTALWHIRRCLPDGSILISDTRTVQFDRQAGLWLDVEAFEAQVSRADAASLQSALALYRGDFLDGYYDDWIISERSRLEAICVEALARLMAAQEAAGEPQTALSTAQRLLDRDPLREDAHRLAMRAHCRLGRRNAALEQYARCQQVVGEELGAEPMGETTALYQAILDGEVPVGTPSKTLPAEIASVSQAGHSPLDVITPVRLVGREQEMELLHGAWQEAQTGQTSMVLVSGEAGVGKTRLVDEFANRLRWQGMPVLCGRCYEFERALPYQPLAEALHTALPPLADHELAAFPAWALGEVARLVPELQERRVLGDGAGSPAPSMLQGRRTHLQMASDGLGLHHEQTRLFEAVSHILAALSSQAPLLLVLEDLHWASESTLGLVHHLARHLADHPVLCVGTFRPETIGTRHPLRALRRRLAREGLARPLRLPRLLAESVETIIVEMSGAGDAVIPLARRLHRETEGNPFFLMEIVKALFETHVVRLEGGAWQGDFAGISAGALPLPTGVSAAIQARVRRLEKNPQEALHLAAVLGREFNFDLFDAVWGRGEEMTLEALEILLRRRLIEEGVAASDSDFAFTHHKIQEVTYQSLPRPRRLRLHAQVGKAIEAIYPAERQARAGELAHHFERACLADRSLCEKAVSYLLAAGQQAVRQSANREAVAYYRRGLDILHTLPETDQRLQQEIELLVALGLPMTVIHGYAAAETGRVYDQARLLCRKLGQVPELSTSLVALSRHYGLGGNVETEREMTEQLLAVARAAQDNTLLIEAYRQMGGLLLNRGRLKESRAFWERGAFLYDLEQHESHAYRFGHDPAVSCLAFLAMTLFLLGYPDQAQVQDQNLHRLRQSMTHHSSLALSHCLLGKYTCMRRDVEATLHNADAAVRLGQLHGLPSWTAMGTALRGWALIEQGLAAEGLAELRDGTALWRVRGFAHFVPFFLGLQAEACLKLQMPQEARAALSAACAIVGSGADGYWRAEVYRLEGEVARAEGRNEGLAEAHFRQAIDAAREQDAKLLELRAASSLARLWRAQGRSQEARGMVAGVYDRFDEGFQTYDLQAAGTLLRALA